MLSFDPKNLKVMCSHCHLYWWHKDILGACRWFEETFPENNVYLQEHRNVIVKYIPEDYDEMIAEIEGQLSTGRNG